jgi:hypothetical protein
MFLSSAAGCPFVVPLSFPELPYVNAGSYCVVPFVAGGVRGLCSLWRELDGKQSWSNSTTQRPASLCLYRDLPYSKVTIRPDSLYLYRIHLWRIPMP